MYYGMSGSSDLLVVSIYFIVEFKMMKLIEEVKFLSLYKKSWVIWKLMLSKMLGLMFLILFRRVDLRQSNWDIKGENEM